MEEKHEEHDHECGCDCGDHGKTITLEEVAYQNNFLLNALIQLLVDKKVLSEEELTKKIEAIDAEAEAGDAEITNPKPE